MVCGGKFGTNLGGDVMVVEIDESMFTRAIQKKYVHARNSKVECFHNNGSLLVSAERQKSLSLYCRRWNNGNSLRMPYKYRANHCNYVRLLDRIQSTRCEQSTNIMNTRLSSIATILSILTMEPTHRLLNLFGVKLAAKF